MNQRAPRNRTLTCDDDELKELRSRLLTIDDSVSVETVENQIVNGDAIECLSRLPLGFVDLAVIDPPYNLSKTYGSSRFKKVSGQDYETWFREFLELLIPRLSDHASVYICSDWKTSVLIGPILCDFFSVQNRITWEREKGRGAKRNWKNNTEDIWFCTRTEQYVFNVDDVKLKRKVIAPYRDSAGKPKDWAEEADGNFRLTHPSNIWTDISIPFWSMPENTDHPTQKPEKLIAKLLLASSDANSFVFDPFVGSGTTAVVAKKLGRRFLGIEKDVEYCCWAQKRLDRANEDESIQGYSGGVFWERNSLADQKPKKTRASKSESMSLFHD